MNLKLFPILLFLLTFSTTIFAQNLTYSFTGESRYNLIYELDGEIFVPAKYQKARLDPTKVKAGNMKVSIYAQRIVFEGVKELNSFNILSKSPDRVGYVYELMDNSGQPARFKVVTDQDKFVNLLYFYSKKLGEHTFFLAQKKAKEKEEEESYYTVKNQLFIRSYKNLIKKSVVPYEKVSKGNSKKQRIKKGESVSFSFEKEEVITPIGTFKLKKSETSEYRLKGHPAVRSIIELSMKGKVKKMQIYLSFKQEIEIIQIGDTRYFLKP